MKQTDMVCEAHPTLLWPHDECPGPGMPWLNLLRLLATDRATIERLESENTEKRFAAFLDWRGIEQPCKKCGGAGVYTYGSTATWHHGIGGQVMTTAHCDQCWGSGDANKPWVNLRQYEGLTAQLVACELERDTWKANNGADATGHMLRCTKVNGEWNCAKGCLAKALATAQARVTTLEAALTAIAQMKQDDLREQLKSGNNLKMLAALSKLFNACRDIAHAALHWEPRT